MQKNQFITVFLHHLNNEDDIQNWKKKSSNDKKRKISILILRQNFMLWWLPYIYITHSTQRQLIVAVENHLLIFLAALVIFLCRLILQLLLLLFLRKHCDKVSPINDKKNIDTLKCEKNRFFSHQIKLNQSAIIELKGRKKIEYQIVNLNFTPIGYCYPKCCIRLNYRSFVRLLSMSRQNNQKDGKKPAYNENISWKIRKKKSFYPLNI